MQQPKPTKVIYFGAGGDSGPLRCKALRGVKTFIFVDALPNNNYYPPETSGYALSVSIPAIIADLISKLKDKQKLTIEIDEPKSFAKIIYRNRVINYYFNRTVVDFVNNAETRAVCASCDTLFVEGFHAIHSGLNIIEHLPNLNFEILEGRSYDRRYWFPNRAT